MTTTRDASRRPGRSRPITAWAGRVLLAALAMPAVAQERPTPNLVGDDGQAGGKKVPADVEARIAFASSAGLGLAIDGRLAEPAWTSAVPFSGFRRAGEQSEYADEQASFRVLHDDTAVYFGIEVPLADARRVLEELKAAPLAGDPKGDVYSARHSVEIFLQPPGQSRYIQCVASLDGYRFDCTGLGKENFAWKGTWSQATGAADDRWQLEVAVPAADLALDSIPAGDGWRLNVVANGPAGGATWAAVGNDFHKPFGFGGLVLRDFSGWRQAKLLDWDRQRAAAVEAAGRLGLSFADRLARTTAYSAGLAADSGVAADDWQAITRTFGRINYVDSVFRGIASEIAFAR